MFCPKCRNEYRDGFSLCNDCGAPLTAELPEPETESPKDPDELVLLIAGLDQVRLTVAKGALESAKIFYTVEQTFPVSASPFDWEQTRFRLFVARLDAKRAAAELREGFRELLGSESSYPD